MASSMAQQVASKASVPLQHLTKTTVAPLAAASSVLLPGQQAVECRWWTGEYNVVDPARYKIDGKHKISKEDLQSGTAFYCDLQAKYADAGLVHVVNTGLTDMQDQRTLANLIMDSETEYEGGANPRGRTEGLANVYDIGAPLEAHLHYHHEMTYKAHSVESLGFLCKHAVNRGEVGWSFVSDTVQAHDYLMQTPVGPKLKELGLCFLRRMTDAEAPSSANPSNSAIYNHWQTSWMTNDPAQAEIAAHAQGLHAEWVHHPTHGRIMQTRYYKSAFEYFPQLDRNILVTSIADDGEWFDTWPGICQLPQEERPLEMLWGDDTPITLEEKQIWTDAYDLSGIPIDWSAIGEVAVLDNLRYAHGRPGVHLLPGEKRELGVMLGKLYELQETQEDKPY